MQALAAFAVTDSNFADLRLSGEWDRGEAVIISALAHSTLSLFDLILGIQTGTTALTALTETKSASPGIKRIRSFGKVAANDFKYLSADVQHTDALVGFPTDASFATLRFSQISSEFEADVDDQFDDYFSWTDNNSNQVVDAGDTFSINLEGVSIHGLNVGRIIHVIANWRRDGIKTLSDAFLRPKLKVSVNRNVTHEKIVGASSFFARVSYALRSVNDDRLSDEISSEELGNILYSHGLVKQPPKGYFRVHMRKLFHALRSQGVRAFLPAVFLDGDGSSVLAVENERNSFGDYVNFDMMLGDSRHFGVSNVPLIPADCNTPGYDSLFVDAFYYSFRDPTFNGSIEFIPAAFDGACSSSSSGVLSENFYLNKWLAGPGLPIAHGIGFMLTMAESPSINLLRGMLVGSGPEVESTMTELIAARDTVQKRRILRSR